MTCRTYEGGLTICGEEMGTIRDERHGEDRWCFKCRKVREFRFVVIAPVRPSYYGPNPSIRCSSCGLTDGDMFPGGYREWEGG